MGCKINTQKSIILLYPSNEQSRNKIKKTSVFSIASKRTAYLRINVRKRKWDLETESYKILLIGNKKDLN